MVYRSIIQTKHSIKLKRKNIKRFKSRKIPALVYLNSKMYGIPIDIYIKKR